MSMILAALALAAAQPAPADVFFERLQALCGKAYEGRLTSNDPADEAFRQPVTIQVRCAADEVRLPVQVGEDRSRTWVVTRKGGALTLKHDHQHADGSEDPVSKYGGTTAAPGTVSRQEFPADEFSKALFEKQGRSVSKANVWAMEIAPAQTLAYELNRPGRHFRLVFDLAHPR